MAEGILISDILRNTRLSLTNRLRLLRWRRLDYIVLRVTGSYPERTLRRRRRFPLTLLPWPPAPPSVASFDDSLERIAVDPRVHGVVLVISGLSAGPATLSSLRASILRLREAGKQCIAYMHEINTWSYYLASACGRIFAPESASFRANGLWAEALFLKDTLALVGLEADFEAMAEYKVSPDTFRRSEMTAPHREMLESMMDSLYGEVMRAVAHGRGLAEADVCSLFDQAPLTAARASQAGLLDGTCYEDELAQRLGTPEEPATLAAWGIAHRQLVRPTRWRSRKGIGVISLVGTIVHGPSQRLPIPIPLPLPLPSAQAGSYTLVQQLRAAARDKRLAAVILHVDSPGGSALASDLIWREVAILQQTKPVVVYMSNRAASGGYYVSAAANQIVAQPVTLTGSIGIWGGKIVAQGLYDRLRAGRESVSRGRSAAMYSDYARFSDEERARVRSDIGTGYTNFKDRVADGRGLSSEQVEAIARGRVWTGEQAREIGLVDALGDLREAADRARQLAGISPARYTPLLGVVIPKGHYVATPVSGAPSSWMHGIQALIREGVYAMAPWSIRVHG